MKNLRRDFERFCYRHRDKGIPQLMLVISIISLAVYFIGSMDPSGLLYRTLRFDRGLILQGQLWRLITYIFIPEGGGIFLMLISVYFYYLIGKLLENQRGRCWLNLFYFTGVLITDIAALLLGCNASVSSLNLSLFLAFATIFPENRVLLFMIIPIKMKYMAWVYFGITLYELIVYPFPINLFPVIALLNYFLFFGADVLGVLPDFLRPRKNPARSGWKKAQKPNPDWARDYRSKSGEVPYHHKCTVCGRTDASHPDLEFRYCSRCSGYHCYCLDHINNHEHID